VGLLRFLAAEAVSGGGAAPTQRLIASSALRLPNPESRSAGAAVRVQVGRLRKLLDAYYATAGAAEEIRVEIPLRDYRLRFLRNGQPLSVGQARPVDTPVLAVTETRSLAQVTHLGTIFRIFGRSIARKC